MTQPVLQSLRGKVLQVPEPQEMHPGCTVTGNCEDEDPWTPMKADLHMHSIKVRVHNPVPQTLRTEDQFENTLQLLNMVKELKRRENMWKKDDMIRKMALEQKKKNKIY